MPDDTVSVSVHHGDSSWNAGLASGDRADQLLVKSLHHFGLDPADKGDWKLVASDGTRDAERQPLVLDHPIGDQLSSGARVELVERGTDDREAASGSYEG